MPAKSFLRVRKTFDGTTSHSTWLSKDDSQVAGYGRAPVGARFIGRFIFGESIAQRVALLQGG